MGRAYLLLALTALSCADMTASTPQPAQLERVDLQMREVPVGDRRMNVTADVPLTVVDTIVHHFLSRMSADVFGVWAIPGEPDHYIVFGEQPMKNSVYGPQVFVVRHGFGTVDVIHETARMMDADFLDPAFFRHRARLLMLADFGSEDSWGLVALHLAPNAVQDLGIVDVVRPGTFDFTESALPAVAVFVERGRYVLKVRGEVIESPTDAPTKSLAVKGQRAVFRQTKGRFVFTGTECCAAQLLTAADGGPFAGAGLKPLFSAEMHGVTPLADAARRLDVVAASGAPLCRWLTGPRRS